MSTEPMSEAHKEALAQGRADGRAVRVYLEALKGSKPRRGRPFDLDKARGDLAEVDHKLVTGGLTVLDQLQLSQRRLKLQGQIDSAGSATAAPDLSELEDAFVKAAPSYSERKGLSFSAWRSVGVPSAVLRKAGITK